MTDHIHHGTSTFRSSDRLPAVSNFLRRYTQGSSRATMRRCLVRLVEILELESVHLEHVRWQALTPDSLQLILESMQKSGQSFRYNVLILNALRGVLKETLSENLLTDVHIARARSKLPNGNIKKHAIVHAKIAMDNMLINCDKDLRSQGIRDAAIITLLYDCGISTTDVVGLNTQDVDMTRGYITLQKRGARQTLALSHIALARLSIWVSLRSMSIGGSGILFNRIRKGRNSDSLVHRCNSLQQILPGLIQEVGLSQLSIRNIIKERSVNCAEHITTRSISLLSKSDWPFRYSDDDLRNAMSKRDF
jgi:site-specific recombinase XerC